MLAGHLVLAFVLFVVAGTEVFADEPSAIKFIPANSSIVIRLNRPAETLDKLTRLATKIQSKRNVVIPVDSEPEPGLTEWIRVAQEQFPKREEGADFNQDWWLIFPTAFDLMEMEDMAFAWVGPAKDLAIVRAIVSGMGAEADDTQFIEITHDSWSIYGAASAIEAIKRSIDHHEESLGSRLGTEGARLISDGDYSVFVGMQNITATETSNPAETIEGTLIHAIRETFSFLVSFDPFQLFAQQTDQSVAVIECLSQAICRHFVDTEYLTASISIEDEELRFECYQAVKGDSLTAKFLSSNPGSAITSLSTLPPSSAIYLGMDIDWKGLRTWVRDFIKSNWSDEGGEGKFTQKHDEVWSCFDALNYGAMAIAFPMRPIDQGLLRSLTIVEVDQPELARDLNLRWSELPPVMIGDAIPVQKPERTIEKYRDFSADVVHYPPLIAIPELETNELNLPAILHGPDGNTTRTFYLNDRIVEGTGGSKARMAAAIRRITEASNTEASSEPAFEKMRAKLGKNVTAIVIIDTSGLAVVTMQLWNCYVDAMLAEAKHQIIQAAGIAVPNGMEMDEGLPAESVDTSEDDSDKDDHEVEANGLLPAQKIEVEIDGEVDQVAKMKIEMNEIQELQATSSLIGFSFACESSGTRMRIVVPVNAIHHMTKAFDIFLNRFMEQEEGIILGIDALEMAPKELEDREGDVKTEPEAEKED